MQNNNNNPFRPHPHHQRPPSPPVEIRLGDAGFTVTSVTDEDSRSTNTADSSEASVRPVRISDRDRDAGVLGPDGVVYSTAHPDARKYIGARASGPNAQGEIITHITLPYALTKAQNEELRTRFPGVRWKAAQYGGHDHPMAHAETMLATRKAQSNIKANETWLDIYGDPATAASFNSSPMATNAAKRLECHVDVQTERDQLRALYKWGPAEGPNGEVRYFDVPIREMEGQGWLNGYLSIHSIYYVSTAQIARLLGRYDPLAPHEGKKLVAVLHRHRVNVRMTEDGERALTGPHELFGGEFTYENDGFSVKQINRETGESYSHASMEWLWDSPTKVHRDAETGNAFTWDLQKFTDNTWICRFAPCSAELDEGIGNRVTNLTRTTGLSLLQARRQVYAAENARPKTEPMQPLVTVKCGTVATVRGVATVSYPGLDRELKITNPRLYNHLRTEVAGKPRDNKALETLYACARRHMKDFSKFPGSLEFECSPDTLSDHVIGALLADVHTENEMLGCIAANASALRSQRALTRDAHRAHTGDASGAVSVAGRVVTSVAGVLKRKDRLAALGEMFDA